MNDIRPLVLKRHPNLKGHLVLCDEETGHILGGLVGVSLISDVNTPATITATFEAFGQCGVRIEDDDQTT